LTREVVVIRSKTLRAVLVPTVALGAVLAIPLAAPPESTAAKPWTPMTSVQVYFGATGATAKGRVLSFNDFHGALEPPTGSGGLVNGNPAGGVSYLATHVKRLRAAGEQAGEDVITAAAGDLVGATPLISAAFHDEPSIEVLNSLDLDVSSVGNHEFDEGVAELKRLQNGGCHPTDGCQDGDGYAGADFGYLASNVVDKTSGKPILPPTQVRKVNGVKVGFVGMTLEGTPSIVNPSGIKDVKFLDEIETANVYAKRLKGDGVQALVLLIHEGGAQGSATPPDPSSCASFAGPITDIVEGLDPAFGLVVSGHTHRFYSCSLPNSQGTSVVTSAGANGTLVTDIGFQVDKATKKFASIAARNVTVENGVRNPDGTWQKNPDGTFVRNPDTVDADAQALVDEYREAVAPIANKVVGSIASDITRTNNAAGESALGDVIADAQLAYTSSAQAQLALMNPGGIRADLTYANSPGGEQPGQVTYGEAFTVQPFNNLVVTQTLTGAQLKEVLEQQFMGYAGQTSTKILQVSAGFSYSYNATLPLGSRVSGPTLNGTPIDPAASYRVTSNDFLANGGDGFTRLTAGTDRVTAPGFDVDALVALLGAGAPVEPGPQNRIVKTG